MRRNKSILTLFSVIQLAALSNGATISGTVSDTVATPLTDVKVILTGLSIPTFSDSTLTGADGTYTFNDISAATYRISLRSSGFLNKDSSIIMGNGSIVCNFFLSSSNPGPGIHFGIVGGTWLPEENPHRIIDTATIKDSLFIAPGCSVIIDKRLNVEGKLTVGSPNGATTTINGDNLFCNNSLSSISFARTIFNTERGLFLSCSRIKFDSVVFPMGSNDIKATDSIIILRTSIGGGPIDPHTLIRPVFQLSANNLYIEKSLFNDVATVVHCDSSLSVSYSIFDFSIEIKTLTPTVFLNHCNFNSLRVWDKDLFKSSSVSIQNNIIFSLVKTAGGGVDSIFVLPFSFNIFKASSEKFVFFGLLANTQTNVNGDSCDNWFNMRSDPLFADTTFNILNSSSPAIGAASDGINIGCYQGQGVGILYPRAGKNTVKSENSVQLMNGGHNCLYLSFPILKSELKMSVYKATGQCVFSRNIPKGQRLISLPFGLSSGVYVYTVHHVGKAATGKFIIH